MNFVTFELRAEELFCNEYRNSFLPQEILYVSLAECFSSKLFPPSEVPYPLRVKCRVNV